MTKRFVTLALTMLVTAMAALNVNAQTWSFNVGSLEGFQATSDYTNLEKDRTSESPTWELVSGKSGRYQPKTSISTASQLAANNVILDITKGLYFTGKPQINSPSNCILMPQNGTLTIKNLKKDMTVLFRAKSNSKDKGYLERTENLTEIENGGFAFVNSETDNKATVTVNGDITITAKDANINIHYITIYDTDGTTVLTKAQVLPEEISEPTINYDSDNKTVTITPGQSSHENSVTTYYTIDGTAPTSASTSYSAPFVIDASCTVKAISISSETISSSVAERNVIVSEPNKVTLTLTADPVSGGTFTVNGEEYTSALQFNENTMQIVTATPANGYQFTKWQGTTNTKGDNYQVSLGTEDCNLTAEFKLTPTTVTPVTEQTLWTFDTFTDGTILSGANAFEYNGLYICGNASNESKQATISANGANAIDGFEAVNKRVVLNGALPPTDNLDASSSKVNTIGNHNKNSVAFQVGVAGTVYVYMNGTYADSRKLCIYSSDDMSNPTTVALVSNPSPQVVQRTVSANANIFIGVSGGTAYIYAVKFVPDAAPANTYTLTTVVNPEGKGTINYKIENESDNTTATSFDEGTSLVFSVSSIDSGYEYDKWQVNGEDASAESDGTLKVTMNTNKTVSVVLKAKGTPQTPTVPMILVAGQSNADGRIKPSIAPLPYENYSHTQISYCNGVNKTTEGTFTTFDATCDADDQRWGFDAALYDCLETALESNFYVVKQTKGSTAISTSYSSNYCWSADATWLSENTSANEGGKSLAKALVSNVKACVQTLQNEGKTADIKCLFWHQGESDRGYASAYKDNLTTLVAYIRTELATIDSKYANLPIIVGTISQNSNQYNATIDGVFRNSGISNFYYIDMATASMYTGDSQKVHFDATSATYLGKQMFNKMIELSLISGTPVDAGSLPEPVVDNSTTYDFITWATENLANSNTYSNLTLDGTAQSTIDGNTSIYKVEDLEGSSDNLFLQGRFAIADNSGNKVQVRGTKGLYINSQSTILSILNLNPGDAVTITLKATDKSSAATFWSDNAYDSSTSGNTVISKGDAVGNDKTYIIRSGHQIDLVFGGTNSTSYYIEKVKITPSEVTENVNAPTISTESSIGKTTVTITAENTNLRNAPTIYYTTDDSNPTTESTKYTAPFDLTANITVKAIAVSNGVTNGKAVSKQIEIAEPSAAVTYDFKKAYENDKTTEDLGISTSNNYTITYLQTDGTDRSYGFRSLTAEPYNSVLSVMGGNGSLVADGLSVAKDRPVAIHNLKKGDVVRIEYSGELLFANSGGHGDGLGGLNKGDVVKSLQAYTISTMDAGTNNYVVFTPTKATVIKQISINQELTPYVMTDFYISPDGNDTNIGTESAPLKSLKAAQGKVASGGSIYIKAGTYTVDNEYMDESNSTWNVVFNLNKDNVTYIGEVDGSGNRPKFDFSSVAAKDGKRVTGFLLTKSKIIIKNIETIGIKTAQVGSTQSEFFRLNGAKECQLINIAAHDGEGIGFYLHGSNTDILIQDCDAYNNADATNNNGENNDGFGAHGSGTGNKFLRCRAWNNADDGFDLKGALGVVTIEECVAYSNGSYNSIKGNGNGIKAGGFGKGAYTNFVSPMHVVKNSIAANNTAAGFYSNHHPGGLQFEGNRAFQNGTDFNMTNRDAASMNEEISANDDPRMQVDGFDHLLTNNISYGNTSIARVVANLDPAKSTVAGNSFSYNGSAWTNKTYTDADFVSVDATKLTDARDAEGNLPATVTNFMKLTTPPASVDEPIVVQKSKDATKTVYTATYPSDATLYYKLPGATTPTTTTEGTESGGKKNIDITVTTAGEMTIWAQKGESVSGIVKQSVSTISNATITLTDDSRKDRKIYTATFASGQKLYYKRPSVDTDFRSSSSSGTNITIQYNGDLEYYIEETIDGTAYQTEMAKITINNIAMKPTATFNSVSGSESLYQITFSEGTTLYYTLPGGTEQTVTSGSSVEVKVGTTGNMVAYSKNDNVTSDEATIRLYAPTPAVAGDGLYDFTQLNSKLGADYTLGNLAWGDAITVGGVELKKPDAVVAKTLDRFAFTSVYTEGETTTDGKSWMLLNTGRLRGKSSAHDKSFAILNLKKGNYLTLTYSGGAEVKYAGGSATLAEGTEVLTSGTGYEILADGDLLLTVPANAGKNCDITVIRIATTETVSAPTLEERTESGEVVSNKVTLRLGTSSFGKTVTAYYTTDGSNPTTSSTAVTKNGAITVDESCTIKAYCVSETGVASGVTEYTVTLPAASKSASAVYDWLNVMQLGDELDFASDGLTVYNKEYDSTDGWITKQRKDFNAATNFGSKVSVRNGASGLSYDTDKKTIRLTKSMAIHNLGVGDEIVIIYTGDGTLRSAGADEGDAFTINGKTATAGMEIPSGATIKVTKTKYANNYVVVTPSGPTSGKVYISSIYINHEAPTVANRPKAELASVDLDRMTSTYRFTFDEGAMLYYKDTKDNEVIAGSNTGTFDLVVAESAKLKAWEMNGTLTSDTLSVTVYAPTPAPSTTGDFDFTEASEDLPADIEVTLDAGKSVSVAGETLYKPSALTAATFGDKFAFTETGSSNKIRIRTNHQLVFAKGTNMSMALLNMKKGDIIAFNYTGSITFADPSQVSTESSAVKARGMTRGVSNDMTSGTAYVVQADGNILLNLNLTEESTSISKMYIAAAPTAAAPAAIDFATASENYEEVETGGSTSVYVYGKSSAQTFKRLVNSSDELPIDGMISTEAGSGEITADGIKAANRHIAIHNLAAGDKITISFFGGALTYGGHETYGNRVSVDGKTLAAQSALKSGDVMVVEKVDYLNNYVVLKLDSKCCISGIFINRDEDEKVWAPTIIENGKNTVLITAGRSSLGYQVTTYYTTDGTDPSDRNGTGGPYDSYDVELLDGSLVPVKAISYSASGKASGITTFNIFADTRTEIIGVPVEDGKEQVIYDLQGRKVESPMEGRIYIIDGKKKLYRRK